MRVRVIASVRSEAEKSGNGLRIFAKYLHEHGRASRPAFTVDTKGGRVVCQCHVAGGRVGEVTVEIQATSGSPGAEIPSGAVLAQGINPKPANTIVGFVSFPPPVFFTDFDLPPVTLQAGVTYALTDALALELRYYDTDAAALDEQYEDAVVARLAYAF